MLAGDQDAAVGITHSYGPPGSDPIQILATDGETVDAKEQKPFFSLLKMTKCFGAMKNCDGFLRPLKEDQ